MRKTDLYSSTNSRTYNNYACEWNNASIGKLSSQLKFLAFIKLQGEFNFMHFIRLLLFIFIDQPKVMIVRAQNHMIKLLQLSLYYRRIIYRSRQIRLIILDNSKIIRRCWNALNRLSGSTWCSRDVYMSIHPLPSSFSARRRSLTHALPRKSSNARDSAGSRYQTCLTGIPFTMESYGRTCFNERMTDRQPWNQKLRARAASTAIASARRVRRIVSRTYLPCGTGHLHFIQQ